MQPTTQSLRCYSVADDLVLLAPSWRALQQLLDKLSVTATSIDMLCNIKKTVRMVFNPKCRSNIVAQKFPSFLTMNNEPLQFVQEFKYLGHLVILNLMMQI